MQNTFEQEMVEKYIEKCQGNKLLLSKEDLSDFGFIQVLNIKQLTVLYCNSTKFIMGSLPNCLSYLHMERCGLKSIEGIQHLKLTHLNISVNDLTSISAIENMTTLTHLNLCMNNLKSIESVKGLVNLVDLDVQNTHISDISPIKELKGLQKLQLMYNHIFDFSPISEHQNKASYMITVQVPLQNE
ncbi:LPXTG_cell wall anchor domain-containing protein [Hexamita inflata]|uniref:LPXTG cell wall anchor domain-containing protein n=1 Tax=Hexamita inflata TaxID=28002 RepID=A0AA86RCJ4_9EUKA|nr:LPXTG cell wall anchor domain-containing protein [Hexamita inflata]